MIPDRGAQESDRALAEGFAAQVERWALARANMPETVALLRRLAFELSRATSEGHVCLFTGESELPRARLLGSGLVAEPGGDAAAPMVLDGAGRLYLRRYFDYECRLARRLVAAAQAPPAVLDAAAAARLAEFFGTGTRVDWQKIAGALALRQRLVIVSGGPGTGKTTMLANLLACQIAAAPATRIALAAPTGKAAARIAEALQARAAHLPAAIRARLPAQASTVHRLLGARPGHFGRDTAPPLAVDLLVVDEASMLDLALATRLFEALAPAARIVLLGDKDQLAAVESGAVFAEISADPSLSEACRDDLARACGIDADSIRPPAPARRGGLADGVVWLQRSYRFGADSPIGRVAAQVHGGRAAEALAALGAGDAALGWFDDDSAALDASTCAALCAGYRDYFDTVLQARGDAAAVAAAFARFRVLCALREGARGAAAINELLTLEARRRLGQGGDPWYAGQPVMVLRNDPVNRLFNGDIGIVLADAAGGLRVHFPDAAGGWRALAPARLPWHETAFASTVHKSQGSEYDDVFIVLPARPARVSTRELLYTALTRARRGFGIAGSSATISAAIGNPTRRHSGLLERLREAGA